MCWEKYPGCVRIISVSLQKNLKHHLGLAAQVIDIERVTMAAYPRARPALNGERWGKDLIRPRLVATQLEYGNLGCLYPHNTGAPQIAAERLYPYRLLRHEYKCRLARSERRDKRAHGPTRRGTLIAVLACK